jgi:hypothetical protein
MRSQFSPFQPLQDDMNMDKNNFVPKRFRTRDPRVHSVEHRAQCNPVVLKVLQRLETLHSPQRRYLYILFNSEKKSNISRKRCNQRHFNWIQRVSCEEGTEFLCIIYISLVLQRVREYKFFQAVTFPAFS